MATALRLSLGVDPGRNGAVALCGSCGWRPLRAKIHGDVADIDVLREFLGYKPEVVVLERVSASPVQSPASAFVFGSCYGLLLGALHCMLGPDTELRIVRPQVWQKAYLPSGHLKGPERKRALHAAAKELAPGCSKAEADAVLLSVWGLHHAEKA